MESKYKFCGLSNFKPGPITRSSIEEINRIASMSKLLKGILGAAPIVLIFASPGASNATANVALTGLNITQTDWEMMAVAAKYVGSIQKRRILDNVEDAYMKTDGDDKIFWGCMYDIFS